MSNYTRVPRKDKTKPRRSRKTTQILLREQAKEARRKDEQELGFCVKEFVLCGLPYQPYDGPIYARQNGFFSLRIEASPSYGMPYGQDRLIPIWLATAFYASGQPEDNTLHLRFATDILRVFGLSDKAVSGVHFQRLKERMQRIFGATYYIRDESPTARYREQRYHLIRRVNLWFDKNTFLGDKDLAPLNQIQLSTEFANDLREGAIPIDLNSVRALKHQPAALDLYVWQAWRSYKLGLKRGIGSPRDKTQKPVKIPVFGPGGLIQHLGTDTQDPYKIKQQLKRWQAQVKETWPACPNQFSKDGKTFLLLPAQALWLDARSSFVGVIEPPGALPPRKKLYQKPNQFSFQNFEDTIPEEIQ